jgi:homoserine kinase
VTGGLTHHAVRVPATTANLGPGFDALGLALDRHLMVRSRDRGQAGVRVEAHGEGEGEVADGDDNLVWRALVAFCEHHDTAVPDVGLVAHCDVPLERGMGSSSAAIVAGLVLARALTGVAVGDRELVALADRLEGHPDNVAPALLGGLVACARDRDGGLVVRRVNPAPALRPLLLVPELRQLTSEARSVLPATLARGEAAAQAARAAHVLAGMAGTWPVASTVAIDLIHEPARLQVMEPAGRVLEALRAAGVQAWLSGAGPSVALMVHRRDPDAARLAATIGADEGFRLEEVDVDLTGALVCPEGGCAVSGIANCLQCPRRRV